MQTDINWDKVDGLLPAIVQSSKDQSVLMLGYMNKESLELTKQLGEVHFYSRTKKRIWRKGETSGNVLKLDRIHLDCDGDAILVLATPTGCVCHTGAENCFENNIPPLNFLSVLEQVIENRIQDNNAESYTRSLVQKGVQRVAQKVGEEGVEVALASVAGHRDEVVEESADLIFHMLVNLQMHKLRLSDVIALLEKRHQMKEGK